VTGGGDTLFLTSPQRGEGARRVRGYSFANYARALLALGALLIPFPARTAGVEDFYRGRSVSLIIGFSVGSGYALYARLLARHIGKHIPGRPSVVAQNMPGAGSVKAANYVFSVAPKDGSVIGTMSRSVPVEPLLGDLQLDARKFTWLGSIASTSSLCATWHTTPIRTWADVLAKPLTLGGEGTGADLDNFAVILRTMFGAKVKLVTGYPGGSEVNLAIERGEVDGRCGWSWDSIKSTRPDWLRDRKINLLVVFSLQKAADIPPEVPLILDLARSDEQRTILRLHLAGQFFGRPFFAPPGIPDERRTALRAAFDATMKDPDFVAEALASRLEVSPASGAEIDRLLAEIYATPRDVVDKARAAIKN
jgi:tripartite-type tricarboxylate transporter receptor subunit TctC